VIRLRKPASANEKGVTLLELIIAIVISVIVMAAANAIFTGQHKSYVKSSSVKEMQESIRAALEILKSDLMTAGYGLDNKDLALCIVDGGSSGPDKIYINYSDFLSDTEILSDTLGSTNIISISGSTVTVGTVDLDSDSTADFKANYGVITDNTNVTNKAAEVNGVGAANITLASGYSLSGNYIAPAVNYRIDTANAELEKNRQPLAGNIVDLQVAYRDKDGHWHCDGGTYSCPMSSFKPEDIKLLRVSLVARTDKKDLGWSSVGRPAVENRTAGSTDDYFYRTFTILVKLRNTGF